MRYYIPGIPEPEAQALAESLTPTEGTIECTGTYPGLLDDTQDEGILFEVVKSLTVWQLFRTADLKLHFVHATPSSGTRVATVDLRALREVTPCDVFFLGLVWAPQELRLSIGRLDQRGILHTAHGAKAPFTVQVAADDKVIYLGDHGLEVMGARIYAAGKTVLRPSAWDTWQEIRRAVDTLLTGSSPEGYLFEVVVVNTVLTFLVTGFEAYCQTRFYEMESEGWTLDLRAIVRTFLTREEQDRFERGDELDVQRYAKAAGWSFTRALVEKPADKFSAV